MLPKIKSRSRAPSALSNKQKPIGLRSHRFTDPSFNRGMLLGPESSNMSSYAMPVPPSQAPGGEESGGCAAPGSFQMAVGMLYQADV